MKKSEQSAQWSYLLLQTMFKLKVQTVSDDLRCRGDGWHSGDSIDHESSLRAHVCGDHHIRRGTSRNSAIGLDVASAHNLVKQSKQTFTLLKGATRSSSDQDNFLDSFFLGGGVKGGREGFCFHKDDDDDDDNGDDDSDDNGDDDSDDNNSEDVDGSICSRLKIPMHSALTAQHVPLLLRSWST